MGIFDFLLKKREDKSEKINSEELLQKIEVLPGLSMAKAFALHWPEIEKKKFPYVSISATPKEDLTLEQSKFGHYPCIPLGFDYPKDAAGNFMYPLAQINCKEMPALSGYPDSGYLQFYISVSDDVYGLDFEDPQSQKNFRVLYFEEKDVANYKSDFSFLDDVMKTDMTPVHMPHSLTFSLKDEYVGIGDVRYDESELSIFAIAKKYPSISDKLEETAYEDFSSNGHKIGGYAYFTQSDPRGYNDQFKNYILLFQLDSDDHIMWGDVGVANFFIHPEDLAKKDFTKVMYNWDCS